MKIFTSKETKFEPFLKVHPKIFTNKEIYLPTCRHANYKSYTDKSITILKCNLELETRFYIYICKLKGIVSRKFDMLLLVPLDR
jgi:hypothetical protein